MGHSFAVWLSEEGLSRDLNKEISLQQAGIIADHLS
jgi:hypothetical protein